MEDYSNKKKFFFDIPDEALSADSSQALINFFEDEVDKNLLRASIEKLSNRERNIMELRFGFISGEEKTQKEVADMLRNITKLHI